MFSAATEKDILVTGVLLQEKANVLYELLFPDATMPFLPVQDLDHDFTTSGLAEQ